MAIERLVESGGRPVDRRTRRARRNVHVLLPRDERPARRAARRGRAACLAAGPTSAGRLFLGGPGPADDRRGRRRSCPAGRLRRPRVRAPPHPAAPLGVACAGRFVRGAWRWPRGGGLDVHGAAAGDAGPAAMGPAAVAAGAWSDGGRGRQRRVAWAMSPTWTPARCARCSTGWDVTRRRRWPAAAATGWTPPTFPSDDEPRVSDEVADLDGEGLRRVASLAGRSGAVRRAGALAWGSPPRRRWRRRRGRSGRRARRPGRAAHRPAATITARPISCARRCWNGCGRCAPSASSTR